MANKRQGELGVRKCSFLRVGNQPICHFRTFLMLSPCLTYICASLTRNVTGNDATFRASTLCLHVCLVKNLLQDSSRWSQNTTFYNRIFSHHSLSQKNVGRGDRIMRGLLSSVGILSLMPTNKLVYEGVINMPNNAIRHCHFDV